MKSEEEMRRRAVELSNELERDYFSHEKVDMLVDFAAEARESAIRECAKVCRDLTIKNQFKTNAMPLRELGYNDGVNCSAEALERLLPPPNP